MAKKKVVKKANKELENLNFEQAIANLTQIVDKIETGQVPLQESLEQYEKGMALIAHCRGILQTAEKRIQEIESRHATTDDESDEDIEDIEDDEDIEADDEEESLF